MDKPKFSKPKLFDKTLINKKKDCDISGVEGVADSVFNSYKEKTFKVIEKINEIGLPKDKHQIRIVTKRSFNTVAFLQHITKTEVIEKLIMVVYSINFEAAKMIVDLCDANKVKEVFILMSNLRNTAHRKKEELTKQLFLDNPKISLIFASSHAKITAAKTTKGNYYVIEGSGNLSYNSRIEQYVIDNDKDLFHFTENWIKEIREYLKGRKELIEYIK